MFVARRFRTSLVIHGTLVLARLREESRKKGKEGCSFHFMINFARKLIVDYEVLILMTGFYVYSDNNPQKSRVNMFELCLSVNDTFPFRYLNYINGSRICMMDDNIMHTFNHHNIIQD